MRESGNLHGYFHRKCTETPKGQAVSRNAKGRKPVVAGDVPIDLRTGLASQMRRKEHGNPCGPDSSHDAMEGFKTT